MQGSMMIIPLLSHYHFGVYNVILDRHEMMCNHDVSFRLPPNSLILSSQIVFFIDSIVKLFNFKRQSLIIEKGVIHTFDNIPESCIDIIEMHDKLSSVYRYSQGI
ncbi:hypothetical protein WA158_005368 [Blastocystis sp. Blastoise]